MFAAGHIHIGNVETSVRMPLREDDGTSHAGRRGRPEVGGPCELNRFPAAGWLDENPPSLSPLIRVDEGVGVLGHAHVDHGSIVKPINADCRARL